MWQVIVNLLWGKHHQTDLWPNTALRLSSSCPGSNQPSSTDHCSKTPGDPGLMKTLMSPERDKLKGNSDVSPPVQLRSKTECVNPGEPTLARFAEQKSSDALAGTGWRELPPAQHPTAADHAASPPNIIVLGKKSQYGIQHFMLILHPGVGFKEKKKRLKSGMVFDFHK